MLELFKMKDQQISEVINKIGLAAPFYKVTVQDSFRRDCAADFPAINDYLEKKQLLPRTSPRYIEPLAPCPASGCPPTYVEPRVEEEISTQIVPVTK